MISKIALILRGTPGSGKSTFANLISENFPKSIVHAIDDLHSDQADFHWDESKADSLYLLNYSNFIQSCASSKPLVVCDCMNLKFEEVEQYANAARKFGYYVYVITPDLPPAEVSTARNKHKVSLVQIKSMLSSWENWPQKDNLSPA